MFPSKIFVYYKLISVRGIPIFGGFCFRQNNQTTKISVPRKSLVTSATRETTIEAGTTNLSGASEFTLFLVGFVLLDLYFHVYALQIVVCLFVLFLLAIALSVLLRYTDSEYLFWYLQNLRTSEVMSKISKKYIKISMKISQQTAACAFGAAQSCLSFARSISFSKARLHI